MTDIKIEQLTKDYGQGRGVFDVNLNIQRGEIFGFIGTNGSGKTTTIRQMMGFIQPDEGNITIRGLDAQKDRTETKAFIGYVPGEIAFPDLPSGKSFIRFQAELLKLKDLSFADELVKVLQIDLRANPRKMSKGMKQKTAIIAALMDNSDILILDEPTTGLDPLMRKIFLDILKNEKKKGKTIFITSNIFQEIEELCDRVALIENGRVIDVVNMEEIRNPKIRQYKIEFINKQDFESFLKRPYEFIRIKNNQYQVIIKLDVAQTTQLLRDLSTVQLKFIAEERYTLEKYFREKFNEMEE